MKKKGSVLLGVWILLAAALSMPTLSSCDDGIVVSFATATEQEIKPITRKTGELYGKLPTPMRKGYTFLGWKTEKMGGEYVRRSVKVTKDIDHTLYAKWRKDEEEITFPLEPKKERLDGAGGATFYIDEEGQLYAWGKNHQGQLGDGTMESQLSPMAVMADKKWVQVDGDDHGTMHGIDADGNLWSWGARKKRESDTADDAPPQLTPERILPDKKFRAIETGWGFYRHFALALDINGGLWAWGDNYYGQLGQGGETSDTTNLGVDSGDDTPRQIKKDVRFVEISTNGETCGAIDEEGKLWLWGENTNGELANGKLYNGDDLSTSMSWLSSSTPTVAIETDNVSFTQVYCTLNNTFAMDKEGNIWACGNNKYAQVGDGTKQTRAILQQITKGLKFLQVYSSLSFSMALDEYGAFWWWGDGTSEEVWELSCVHFEKNPIHFENRCEGLYAYVPTESTVKIAKGVSFYAHPFKIYMLSQKGELWGWHVKTVKGLKYFTSREDAGYTLGNGTWEYYDKKNPIQFLFKEVS